MGIQFTRTLIYPNFQIYFFYNFDGFDTHTRENYDYKNHNLLSQFLSVLEFTLILFPLKKVLEIMPIGKKHHAYKQCI